MPSAIVKPTSVPPASGAQFAACTPTMRTSGRRSLSAIAIPDGEPAAPDRDDEHVELRQLVGQLEPDRPLAGDHVVVLERVDERRAGVRPLTRRGLRLVVALAGQHDLGAVAPGRLDLRHRRVLGHEDRRLDARLARRPGHRLPVVAGARGDDARGPLAPAESARSVLTAPRILNEPVRCRFSAFSQHGSPAEPAERLRGGDGRDARDALEALLRGLDVGERGCCSRGHLL